MPTCGWESQHPTQICMPGEIADKSDYLQIQSTKQT
jgi:hypothetical protein